MCPILQDYSPADIHINLCSRPLVQPHPPPPKHDLRRKGSQQAPASATQQQDASSKGRVAESPIKASRPHSAPRIPLRCVEVGTLKPSVTALAQEGGTSEGGLELTTKPEYGKAGVDEDRKTGSPREQPSFVAARPEVNPNAWRSPSPIRRSKAVTSNDKSFSSGLAADTRPSSAGDGPSSVRPTHVDTNEPKNPGDTSSKEEGTAIGGSRQERRKQPSEHTETAVTRKTSWGNAGGDRNISRDTAPKMLLAREAGAAIRRAERVAAAREKEEREIRLSSSFRAKEV